MTHKNQFPAFVKTGRIDFKYSLLKSNPDFEKSRDFMVCRAWQFPRSCKSTVGVCNRQPLANSKGGLGEEESEGSQRQNSAPRHTNHIRDKRLDETTKQVKVQRLHGHRGVNMAGTWSESGLSYRGISHRGVETA